MTLLSTAPSEFGTAAADSVREITSRLVGSANISTYIEGETPLRWAAIGDAGWDLVGVIEDEDSMTLRDLVAVAQAWGENPIQLPLVPSIVAKRHCAAAAEWDGPVSFAVPTQTATPGWGVVPYGQVSDIAIVEDFASGDLGKLADTRAVDFDPVSRSVTVPFLTRFTPPAARDLVVLWAAEAAGAAKRIVTDAISFTKEREQFGKPVGSFQAVKHQMANAHIAVEQAETAAIWASLEEQNSARACLHSLGQSITAVERALQVHGGLGFTWEMGVHFYLRHVVSLREYCTGVLAQS